MIFSSTVMRRSNGRMQERNTAVPSVTESLLRKLKAEYGDTPEYLEQEDIARNVTAAGYGAGADTVRCSESLTPSIANKCTTSDNVCSSSLPHRHGFPS